MVIITPDNRKYQKFFQINHTVKCELVWVRNNMSKAFWESLENEESTMLHKAICHDCKKPFVRMFKSTKICDTCELDREESRRLNYE